MTLDNNNPSAGFFFAWCPKLVSIFACFLLVFPNNLNRRRFGLKCCWLCDLWLFIFQVSPKTDASILLAHSHSKHVTLSHSNVEKTENSLFLSLFFSHPIRSFLFLFPSDLFVCPCTKYWDWETCADWAHFSLFFYYIHSHSLRAKTLTHSKSLPHQYHKIVR